MIEPYDIKEACKTFSRKHDADIAIMIVIEVPTDGKSKMRMVYGNSSKAYPGDADRFAALAAKAVISDIDERISRLRN